MKNRVILNINTRDGLYVLPFLDLEKLDSFTSGFDNEHEMIAKLNEILDLNIELDDIIKINISSDKYKEKDKKNLTRIKYSSDNWNINSLCDIYSLYLKQDHRRIRRSNVRLVSTYEMVRFQAGKPISDKGIDLAVKAYFNQDYKNQRDTYFKIQTFGTIRIDKVTRELEKQEEKDLSKAESYNDDFIQYLIELASRGEEYLDKAMDELSKVDLEDISRSLEKGYLGFYDGLGRIFDTSFDEDAYVLVEYTGMSIEELKELQPGSGWKQLSISGFNR